MKTLQFRMELLNIDWWPCSLSSEVAVVVEHFVELVFELVVGLVDELVVDLLVDFCWWVRQVATDWYPLTVVQS